MQEAYMKYKLAQQGKAGSLDVASASIDGKS